MCIRDRGRRLRNRIDPHVLLAAVNVAEAAGDGLQQRLGVGHIVVAVKGALGGDVGERDDRTPVVEGVLLAGHLDHLCLLYTSSATAPTRRRRRRCG